ncbi:MAG: hypothetical protein IT444_03895 [Phycisphaeraceae bacterium]|nr:hypothetical protein [Phycisphaeraceae bacterium]
MGSKWIQVMAVTAAATALAVAVVRLEKTQAAENYSFSSNTPSSVMADQLAIAAEQALSGEGTPRPDQLTLARLLLDQALKLRPNDIYLIRSRAELAEREKEDRLVDELWQRYIKLVPSDDAAQLRYIKRSLDRYQTVDQRANVAEKLLEGPGSDKLSAPLRSRLASYVARMAMESGDNERFGRRLKEAIQLDSSNSDAARMLYDYAQRRGTAPAELGVAVLAMVRANPLDSQARMTLASLLLSQGVYAEAADQFAAGRRVSQQPFQPSDLTTYFPGWVMSLGASGRGEEAISLLSQAEEAVGGPSATQPADTAAATPPLLPMELELIRLAILDHTHQPTAAAASFAKLRQQLRERQQAGDTDAALDRAWLSVLFDRDTEEASQLVTASKASPEDAMVKRINGYLALRAGDTQEARKILAPLAGSDVFAAYGVAKTYSTIDDAERLHWLRRVVASAPATLAGMMAAQELVAANEEVAPLEQGAMLLSRVKEMPMPLLAPNTRESPLVLFKINTSGTVYGFLDQIPATITLQNLSDTALALGPDGAIPTKAVFYVSSRRAGTDMGTYPPVVVDLGRRISLKPHESLQIPLRLDRGALAFLLEHAPTEAVTFSLVAVLDPQLAQGRMIPGIRGATTALRLIQRNGTPFTMENINLWLATFGDAGDAGERMKAISILTTASTRLGDSEEDKEQARQLTTRLSAEYEKLDAVSKAWMLAFLPDTQEAAAAFRPVIESARRSDSTLVRMAFLLSQVRDPASTDIDAAVRSSDPALSEFGKALGEWNAQRAKAEAENAAKDASPDAANQSSPEATEPAAP